MNEEAVSMHAAEMVCLAQLTKLQNTISRTAQTATKRFDLVPADGFHGVAHVDCWEMLL